MSLDGYIATPDGSVAWLDPFNAALGAAGDDGGYGAFIAKIDAVLMGRKTYEQVMSWGWPYEARPAYVLTKDSALQGPHISAAGDIDALATAIAAAQHKSVWILGGGQAQRAALDAGLFDQLRVFVMPTILGAGRPLFSPGAQRNLELNDHRVRPGGILDLTYDIKD
ncbi:MAG: dihydrofolate reductase [Thalassovita sp.]